MQAAIISAADAKLVKDSHFFDSAWYEAQYPDVRMLGMDPVEHYLWLGWRLQRSPSQRFCARSYQAANPDVNRAKLNPLLHYIRYGQKENRPVYPIYKPGEKEARQKARRIVVRRHKDWDESIQNRVVDALERATYDVSALVSIVMPTRNRAFCIANAISSVLAQTHQTFELIVIDDGSTDSTEDVVLSVKDKRIKYVKNIGDNGVSKARNLGLELASGRWVFFLDSDNTWNPKMIEFMLKHAQQAKISSGYCAANVRDDEGNRRSVLYADFDYESCVHENFIDLNCFFMRWDGVFREFRFNEKIRRLVDWEFILRVGARTRIVGVPYIGVEYYDGGSERISNREYTDSDSIQKLLKDIRTSSRKLIVEQPPIMDASAYRIAIVMHLYHADRVEECISYLKNIGFEFDLFVTTSLKEDDASIRSVISEFPAARVFHFPNVGADIGAFLELGSTLKNYFLVCKVHTKRDVGPWGEAWRKALIGSVLGSPELINGIVDRFKAEKSLKIVCSKDLYKLGNRNSIPETLEHVKKIAKDIELSHVVDKDWAFVAGTMFWVRPQIFARLARYMCDSDGYSVLFRQDGALEHGLERALGLVLWGEEASLVGLVAADGDIQMHRLGSGHSEEGVSITLTRLAKK